MIIIFHSLHNKNCVFSFRVLYSHCKSLFGVCIQSPFLSSFFRARYFVHTNIINIKWCTKFSLKICSHFSSHMNKKTTTKHNRFIAKCLVSTFPCARYYYTAKNQPLRCLLFFTSLFFFRVYLDALIIQFQKKVMNFQMCNEQ